MSRSKTFHLADRSCLKILESIRLFVTDVDGVLTDGGMYYGEAGQEMKRFHVWDGMGIKLLQAAGVVTGIITALNTKIVARRGADLKIPEIHQGISDKLKVIHLLAQKHQASLEEIAYMGDDLNDLAALEAIGFSACPANARPEVYESVHYVCRNMGGQGAVREVADLILMAKGIYPRAAISHI